jgi:hypothetical protein
MFPEVFMHDESIEPITCSIKTGERLSGLGRTEIFGLIGEKKVEARKAGRRTLLVVASLRNYLLQLPAYDREQQARKVQAAVEGRQARRRNHRHPTE